MGPGCTNCPVLRTSLFRNLSRDDISRIGCVFRPARYHRYQILFFEGGAAQHLFALHSGLVKMVKSLDHRRERITALLFPGQLFGLEALAEDSYPITAVALGDCEICAAPRDEFFSFMKNHPEIGMGMVRFLVEELERVRTQVTSMSFKDARMKVATFLLSLVNGEAPEDNAPVNLTLPLSRQEISEVLELSPETVSRTLGSFRREKLVAARGRHIVIQNPLGLEAVANRRKRTETEKKV